jgi:hypothetical protein
MVLVSSRGAYRLQREQRAKTVRNLLVALMALSVSGCLGLSSGPRTAAVDPYASTRNDACYTVDLFTPARIKVPGGDVPEEWRGFSGRWGGGAWEGEWCHDLYVLEIEPDGTVHVISAHAPLPAWGKQATAFRRTGRIDRDGRIRLRMGSTQVEYWLAEDGKVHGHRDEGMGLWEIAMVRR